MELARHIVNAELRFLAGAARGAFDDTADVIDAVDPPSLVTLYEAERRVARCHRRIAPTPHPVKASAWHRTNGEPAGAATHSMRSSPDSMGPARAIRARITSDFGTLLRFAHRKAICPLLIQLDCDGRHGNTLILLCTSDLGGAPWMSMPLIRPSAASPIEVPAGNGGQRDTAAVAFTAALAIEGP
jgi:hypothetical protein